MLLFEKKNGNIFFYNIKRLFSQAILNKLLLERNLKNRGITYYVQLF